MHPLCLFRCHVSSFDGQQMMKTSKDLKHSIFLDGATSARGVRGVRINILSRSTRWPPSLWEMEVRGSCGTESGEEHLDRFDLKDMQHSSSGAMGPLQDEVSQGNIENEDVG